MELDVKMILSIGLGLVASGAMFFLVSPMFASGIFIYGLVCLMVAYVVNRFNWSPLYEEEEPNGEEERE